MTYEDLIEVLKNNNIHIPRVHDITPMEKQLPCSKEYIQKELHNCEYKAVSDTICGGVKLNPYFLCYTDKTEAYLKRHATISALHGKKRRVAKYRLKQEMKATRHNIDMFNKYAGRENVLLVYAKLGSWSWFDKWWDFKNEPWFLDACDDYTDQAYCDIYVKVNKSVLLTQAQ